MTTRKTHTNQCEAIYTLPQSGFIRRYRLADALGVNVGTIDRWVKTKAMPQPVKLGEKTTAFDAVEINRWLAERRGEVA